MRPDRHYDALTTEERFALTIDAMARMDIVEIDRLQGAMEQRDYRMSDAGYWRRLQSISTLALRHAYMRRKTEARILSGLAFLAIVEDAKTEQTMLEAIGKLLGNLDAIDDAWRDFCATVPIDPEKALRSAAIDPQDGLDDLLLNAAKETVADELQASPELRAELKAMYAYVWDKAVSMGH